MRTIKLQIVVLLCLFFTNAIHAQVYPGDLILNSQEEVDSFSNAYTSVEGSLFLTGNAPFADRINNVSSLLNLTSVGGKIDIKSTRLTSLTGLDNIIGNVIHLMINNNSALTNIDGIDGLTSVDSTILIGNNSNLLSVDGLNNISGTLEGDLKISGNDELLSINGLNVTSVTGTIELTSNDELLTIDGLNSVTYAGSIRITGNEELLSINGFSGLVTVGISNPGNNQSVIFIYDNEELVSIDGFTNVTEVYGALVFAQMDELASISGFQNLTTLERYLSFSRLNKMTDISGFNDLTSAAEISIDGNEELLDISGFNSITYVGGSFVIEENELLIDISGFSALTKTEKIFNIEDNEQLVNITGFENFTEAGTVNIWFHDKLDNVDFLSSFTTVGGDIMLWGNDLLSSLTGLSNLQNVGGSLRVYDNDNITSLDGLENVTSVGKNLDIYSNGILTDISAVSNVTFVAQNVYVTRNDLLDNCCPLALLLKTPGAIQGTTISFNNNSLNCNDTTIINFICDADGDGISPEFGDCDDLNSNNFPGNIEICDGEDNNCDGFIDEGVELTCYQDMDGDGYGNPDSTTIACACPENYVLDNTDCDDTSDVSYPSAIDICDGLDNNCDGNIDENGICYCDSYGESTQYEWIERVDVNGTTNTSGDDGGYENYTSVVFPVSTGYNNIELEPGFSGGSYYEYWLVWIDLNQDDDFDDAGELVSYAASSNTVYDNFYIPSSAMTGTTRMRIAMKYGYWSNPCDIFSEGEVEDYLVDISFCDNIDDGGTIEADEILCDDNDDPAIIENLEDADGGSGSVEYLWLMSTTTSVPPNYANMNEWTAIANSNSSSYDPDPISATTWYIRCARRSGCIQYTGESNVIEKTLLPGNCVPEHCISEAASTQYEWIKKVKFCSINNLSGNDGGYGDYTNLSTELWTGESLYITLKPGYSGSSYWEGWKVWIDWNQDGDFDDAGELAGQAGGYGTKYDLIHVPTDAMTGNTRMRVSMKYGGYPTACESFSEGEVEDYTVTVVSGGSALVVLQDDDVIVEAKARLNVDTAIEKEEIKPAIHHELSVYPNPAIDQLHVNLESFVGKEVLLKLQNSLGQVIQTQSVTAEAVVSLPVEGLQHGYYLLTVQVKGERVITKQVIIGK